MCGDVGDLGETARCGTAMFISLRARLRVKKCLSLEGYALMHRRVLGRTLSGARELLMSANLKQAGPTDMAPAQTRPKMVCEQWRKASLSTSAYETTETTEDI